MGARSASKKNSSALLQASAESKATKIGIFYATGDVKVPDDLVGKDWALAAVALQNAGLDPRKQSVDSEKNPDEVLAVDKAGDVVKRGTTIVVKVAKTPTSTATVTASRPIRRMPVISPGQMNTPSVSAIEVIE